MHGTVGQELIRGDGHHLLLRRPVEAKLAWDNKIQLDRELLLRRLAPTGIRGRCCRRFITGGLLARLLRSKEPPTRRITNRASHKALLGIKRDDE